MKQSKIFYSDRVWHNVITLFIFTYCLRYIYIFDSEFEYYLWIYYFKKVKERQKFTVNSEEYNFNEHII